MEVDRPGDLAFMTTESPGVGPPVRFKIMESEPSKKEPKRPEAQPGSGNEAKA